MTSEVSQAVSRRIGVHRLAAVTVATTVMLIFVGGVVTTTKAGLSVPDWPSSFGHNMFTFPWEKWVGPVFYEHSHRLLGSLVGFLTVSLAVWIHRVEDRRWVKQLARLAVVGVIVQGILGGLRVVLLADAMAIVHGCLAQAFLSLVVGLAVVTSPGWFKMPRLSDRREARVLRLRTCLTALAFYAQILFGVWVTHTGSHLELHLLFAGVATFATLVTAARVLADGADTVWLHSTAKLLLWLLAAQFVLGLGSMIVRFSVGDEAFSAPVTTGFPILHRLLGAILVATAMRLAWRTGGLTRLDPAPAGHGAALRKPIGSAIDGAKAVA